GAPRQLAMWLEPTHAQRVTDGATRTLADHHYAYAQSPFTALDADLILVTAKDAIKCAALDDPRLWAVQVGTRLSDPDFGDWLSATLRARQP
ncbi:tetraacyldisaccharide 4'-kinase, partial [Bordetella pertussis]|uniref:tetraacyldisaccharide 4'-kinase n=1 Tax=Bordetella pertussis TaxID=520 RepID=UPI000AD49414